MQRLVSCTTQTLGFDRVFTLTHPIARVDPSLAAASFLVSAAVNLPSTDVWCILYPALKYFLRSDITAIKEEAILMALKPPVRMLKGSLSTDSPFHVRFPDLYLMLWSPGQSEGINRSFGRALRTETGPFQEQRLCGKALQTFAAL